MAFCPPGPHTPALLLAFDNLSAQVYSVLALFSVGCPFTSLAQKYTKRESGTILIVPLNKLMKKGTWPKASRLDKNKTAYFLINKFVYLYTLLREYIHAKSK